MCDLIAGCLCIESEPGQWEDSAFDRAVDDIGCIIGDRIITKAASREIHADGQAERRVTGDIEQSRIGDRETHLPLQKSQKEALF